MATYGGAKKNTSPVTQQVVVQQPTANIKYVDQYGNPVAPPIQTQPQQVVVVQQPQPNIRYVDQNGNPVAAPQPVQVQPQPIIKYVDQNGNPVAAPQPVQQAQVQVQPMRAVAQQQQVVTNGGSVWRVTLIVLWSIALTGSIPQLVMSLVALGALWGYTNIIAITLSMLLPGIVSIIGGSISIYGINIYNYTLTVISAISSGILLFFGLVLFTVDDGAGWFLIVYILPFILYSCLFAFSIVFAKHISYVKKNGHPDPNTCCNCACCKCRNCGDACDCYVPPTNQQVVANANANANQLALGGGSCWRLTLIVLWSIALTGGIPQLVIGAIVLFSIDNSGVYTLSLFLPGIVSIIGGSISIYGINIYNYTLTVISAIASGISLFFGLVLFTVDGGYWWFLIAYIPPFILYSCLFAFDIVFAKHISYVKKNGHPDPNTCCNCGDCGDCGNGCDCFGPSTHQHGICQQPGVALQVGVAAQAKDREININ